MQATLSSLVFPVPTHRVADLRGWRPRWRMWGGWVPRRREWRVHQPEWRVLGGSWVLPPYMYHNYKCHTYTGAEPRTPELSADMLPLSHPYGGEQIALKQHGSHCFQNTNMYHFLFCSVSSAPTCKPEQDSNNGPEDLLAYGREDPHTRIQFNFGVFQMGVPTN